MALKQKAYDKIRGRILAGELAPGDMLNRRGVAEELDMSPAPVHEAMIQLECDGLLEALPRRGTRVRTVSRGDVRGHLVVREALECQAARMVCGTPVKQGMKELHSLAEAADQSETGDTERAEAEVEFHIALTERAECQQLTEEYRRVMQIGLFYRINLFMTMPAREPVDRHVVLLEELAGQSPDEAEETVRQHVWSGKPDSIRFVSGDRAQV